jgi:Tfp pilus assembly protein PilN
MIRINLLADQHLKDRLIIQQEVLVGIGALLVSMLCCFFWYQANSSSIEETSQKINKTEAELKSQSKIRTQVKQMEEQERRVKAMVEAIKFLITMKQGPVIYLDTLNVNMPTEIWLTSISEVGGNLTIQGFSLSQPAVAQLMKNMNASGQFHKVELKEIKRVRVGKESVKQFTLRSVTSMGRKLAEAKEKRQATNKKKKGKKRK